MFGPTMRLNGLVTGIDTDSVVRDLVAIERKGLDKLEQQQELKKVTQDLYRDKISSFTKFKDKYFNVLSQDNMLSKSKLSQYKISNEKNDYFKVTGGNNKVSHSISSIDKLATKDKWEGKSLKLSAIESDSIDINKLKESGLNLNLKINGNSKDVKITKEDLVNINNIDDLSKLINDKIDNNIIKVSISDNKLSFESVGNKLSVNSDELSIKNKSNYDFNKQSIGELLGVNGDDLSDIIINNKKINGLKEDMSLDTFINQVNRELDSAQLSYNKYSNSFELTSKKEGVVNNIELNKGASDLLSKIGISESGRTKGQNAELTINGQKVIKDSNNFNLDGYDYSLTKEYKGENGDIKIESTLDTNHTVNKIKEFIKDYNEIIDSLNGALSEKIDRDFQPLTAEQKEAMTDKEIEKWEAQVKKGRLSDSRELRKMVDSLKTALYETKSESGLTMFDIGIKSTSDRTNYGRLELDEDKFIKALNNNSDDVLSVLSNESNIKYSNTSERGERYKENGFMNKVNDIFMDNVRTTTVGGKKGALIERAGIKNDSSFNNNIISKDILSITKRKDDFMKKLFQKEEMYYRKFSKMETYLSKMEAQSAWLFQQTSMM